MSDLINRDDVYDVLKKVNIREMPIYVFDKLWNGIRDLPSAGPEIIHCKDCKWSAEDYDTDGNVPYWICKNWDGGTDADGFCYEAERRTE